MQRIYGTFLLVAVTALGSISMFASESETSCCDFGSFYWAVSGTRTDSGDNANE